MKMLCRLLALVLLCAIPLEARAAQQFIFVNNASTTLAANASSASTTLSLASTTHFPASIPAGQVLALTLNDAATHSVYEVVYVTSIAGANLTVQRGQEGTLAQNWSIGDFAFVGLTAGVEVSLSYGNGQTFANDAGSANAYSVSLLPALTSHITGEPIFWKATNSNTGSSTFNDGAGQAPLINVDGTATLLGQIIGGRIYGSVFDGSSFQLIGATSTVIQTIPAGGVQLQLSSATSLLLAPLNGGNLWINGVNQSVPANLQLSNSGLASGTVYYIYAFMNGGTMTLEASPTSYAFNANGMPQKTGAVTRTFVGLIETTSNGQFSDSGQNRLVASWFYPQAKTGTGTFTTTRGTTLTTFSEVNSEIRVNFVSLAGRDVQFNITGEISATAIGSGNLSAALNIDGVTQTEANSATVPAGAGTTMCIQARRQTLSEGGHFASLNSAQSVGAQAQFFAPPPNGSTSPAVLAVTIME